MKRLLLAPLPFLFLLTVHAQPVGLPIRVTETAGIRRTTYPVSARVEIPEHGLTDISHVRLRLRDADVPAQFQIGTKWPDGSVRALDVDFNASPGPRETLDYAVEYGPSVAAAPPPRGLAVTETADTIQVGSVVFNKKGESVIRSVKYREEEIATGPSSFGVVDPKFPDIRHAVLDASSVTVVKGGPLKVLLRYTGQLTLLEPTYRVPFVLTVEMPSSKTWVKLTATFDDAERRLSSVFFSTVQSVGPPPLLWDFGTANGAYGVFRELVSGVSISEAINSNGRADWQIQSGMTGRPETQQVIESGADGPEIRWGHIQGSKEAIAFAFEHAGQGSSEIALGPSSFLVSFKPATPPRELALTVYEHFVTAPVQVGAATTPAAMLAPLEVR